MTQINKNGNVIVPPQKIVDKNLYVGSHITRSSHRAFTYNYENNIFIPYGFLTCTKLSPASSNTGQFLAYAYITDPTIQYDINSEFVASMYAYVSEDCDANFRLHLEHACTYIDVCNTNNTTLANKYVLINSTKGKVFWIWAKFKPNQTDGKIYLMFYPNPNQTNIFTKGYILYTGVQIYQGTEIYRPSYDSSIHGVYSIPNSQSIYENKIEFNDFIEY